MNSEISQRMKQHAQALKARFADWDSPRAVLQLGTGFLYDQLLDEELGSVALSDLGLTSPAPSPGGNPLKIVLGAIGSSQVLVVTGHRYRFEQSRIAEVIAPVVVAALAGVRDMILLEPVLSLRDDFKPGTWVAATDYINAMGVAPTEDILDLIDNPFADMTDAFSQSLIADIINAAARNGINPRLGVYQGMPGPQFETPAEAEAARRNGADVIGHGIIAETVAASLLQCRITALLLIAEAAPAYHGRRLQHRDILDAAQFCSPDMMRALRGVFLERQNPQDVRDNSVVVETENLSAGKAPFADGSTRNA